MRPGERVCVLGPSEAGKSTLALCLQGLIPRLIKGEFRRPDRGGRGASPPPAGPGSWPAGWGFCYRISRPSSSPPGWTRRWPSARKTWGCPGRSCGAGSRECLALVGLDGLDDRDPATLSGGQKQLLALAAVLSLAPKLLVLDEPTTDLDPVRVEELLATLDRLSRTRDLTLVFLGEDLRLARFCSRIVLLARGKILADGPPEVILREVERLRGLGLNPPELPALFHDLGQATLPLTLEEAVDQARGLGWDQPSDSRQ